MLHTSNPIIKHKAGLLNLAEELGNVSKACKVMGVSRGTFYRYQELAEAGGVDALINQSRRTPNIKNRIEPTTEQAVIAYALEYPAHGQVRTSNELRKGSSLPNSKSLRLSARSETTKYAVKLKLFIQIILALRTRFTWAI